MRKKYDADLLKEIQEGNENAIWEALNKYGQPCYNMAKQLLHSEIKTEEVLHEVMMAVKKHASSIKSLEAFMVSKTSKLAIARRYKKV